MWVVQPNSPYITGRQKADCIKVRQTKSYLSVAIPIEIRPCQEDPPALRKILMGLAYGSMPTGQVRFIIGRGRPTPQ